MDTFKEDNSIHYHHVESNIHAAFQDTLIHTEPRGDQEIQDTSTFRVNDITKSDKGPGQVNTTQVQTYSTEEANAILRRDNDLNRDRASHITREIAKKRVEDNPGKVVNPEKKIPFISSDSIELNKYEHLFVNDSKFIPAYIQHKPVFISPMDTSQVIPFPLKNENNINFQRSDWMLGIILLVLIFFTWTRIFYEKYFTQKIQAVYNTQILGRLRKDRNNFLQRVTFVLMFSYVLVSSLFIYQIFTIFDFSLFNLKGFTLYLTFNLIVLGVYILKYISTFLVGYVFEKRQQFGEYLQTTVIINENIGMFLLPVVGIIPFVDENARVFFVYTGMAIALFFYIFRYYRAIKIIASRDIFIFYVFLYFCTFEILPLVLFYKTFKSYII